MSTQAKAKRVQARLGVRRRLMSLQQGKTTMTILFWVVIGAFAASVVMMFVTAIDEL
jgi:hypothetical protein